MNLDARLPRRPLLSVILLLASLLGGGSCLADFLNIPSKMIFASPNGEYQFLLESIIEKENGDGGGIAGTLLTIHREKALGTVSPWYGPVWEANFPKVDSYGAFVADSGNYVVLVEHFTDEYPDPLLRIVNAKGEIERTMTFKDFYSPKEFEAMPESSTKWWFWGGHMEPGKDVVILDLWAKGEFAPQGNKDVGMKFKKVSLNLATGEMKTISSD